LSQLQLDVKELEDRLNQQSKEIEDQLNQQNKEFENKLKQQNQELENLWNQPVFTPPQQQTYPSSNQSTTTSPKTQNTDIYLQSQKELMDSYFKFLQQQRKTTPSQQQTYPSTNYPSVTQQRQTTTFTQQQEDDIKQLLKEKYPPVSQQNPASNPTKQPDATSPQPSTTTLSEKQSLSNEEILQYDEKYLRTQLFTPKQEELEKICRLIQSPEFEKMRQERMKVLDEWLLGLERYYTVEVCKSIYSSEQEKKSLRQELKAIKNIKVQLH
jgi:hypothetical protein